MINQILLICSSIIVYEFIKYTKLTNIVWLNFKIYRKIIKLFTFKNISDLKKEKLLFVYSKILFFTSIKILFVLIFILVFILIINFVSNSFLSLVFSFMGALQISIVLIIYYQFREKDNAKL